MKIRGKKKITNAKEQGLIQDIENLESDQTVSQKKRITRNPQYKIKREHG